MQPARVANERVLSSSDVASLQRALDEAGNLSFEDLIDHTSADHAYRAASGGRIRYEAMLHEDDPRRAEKAEDWLDTACRAVFRLLRPGDVLRCLELRELLRYSPAELKEAVRRGGKPLGRMTKAEAEALAWAGRRAPTLSHEHGDLIWDNLVLRWDPG